MQDVDAIGEVGRKRGARLEEVGELVAQVFAHVVRGGVVDHPRVEVDADKLRVGMFRRELGEGGAGSATDLEDGGARNLDRAERFAHELEPPPREVSVPRLLVLVWTEFEVCLQVSSYPSATSCSEASIRRREACSSN